VARLKWTSFQLLSDDEAQKIHWNKLCRIKDYTTLNVVLLDGQDGWYDVFLPISTESLVRLQKDQFLEASFQLPEQNIEM
jgi:hypothetical protein